MSRINPRELLQLKNCDGSEHIRLLAGYDPTSQLPLDLQYCVPVTERCATPSDVYNKPECIDYDFWFDEECKEASLRHHYERWNRETNERFLGVRFEFFYELDIHGRPGQVYRNRPGHSAGLSIKDIIGRHISYEGMFIWVDATIWFKRLVEGIDDTICIYKDRQRTLEAPMEQAVYEEDGVTYRWADAYRFNWENYAFTEVELDVTRLTEPSDGWNELIARSDPCENVELYLGAARVGFGDLRDVNDDEHKRLFAAIDDLSKDIRSDVWSNGLYKEFSAGINSKLSHAVKMESSSAYPGLNVEIHEGSSIIQVQIWNDDLEMYLNGDLDGSTLGISFIRAGTWPENKAMIDDFINLWRSGKCRFKKIER